MKKAPARKRPAFRATKEVKKLARERIGTVPAGQIIQPKKTRKSPKHPKQEREAWLEG